MSDTSLARATPYAVSTAHTLDGEGVIHWIPVGPLACIIFVIILAIVGILTSCCQPARPAPGRTWSYRVLTSASGARTAIYYGD